MAVNSQITLKYQILDLKSQYRYRSIFPELGTWVWCLRNNVNCVHFFVSFIIYFNMEVTKCTVTYFSSMLLLFYYASNHHITKGTKLLPFNDLSIIKLFIALFLQMTTYIIIHNQIDQKRNGILCTTSLFKNKKLIISQSDY